MNQIKGVLAFVASADAQSFTGAARMLDVSPQAIASSIARLEAELNVRLFYRTTRSISLTDEGEALLSRVGPTLAEFNEAIASAREAGAAPSGVLRVSTAAAFGRRYLLPQIPLFHERYPGVRLDVSMTDQKVNLVSAGFDVAIRGGKLMDSTLITRRVSALTMVYVASPAYLKKCGVPRTPEALANHQTIALKFVMGAQVAWEFRVRGKSVTFEPKSPTLTLSDTDLIGDAAVAGMGVARMALHFAWPHLQAGTLKLLLTPFNDPSTREMVIHYPHREHVPTRVKVFVDFMLSALAREPSLNAKIKDLKAFEA